ncbi:uncharacterized protein N7446_006098 [Penicillium canescens]|uniref:Uncharacterized protein n=1 Tax=Penicillium canescens TaxID=5083 RepID=A0AAD6IKV8_PENCN|nr:uncharacterized protein N7446_006098 [Penicillium canescens]KAJ6051466.1 hypothetical protein N7460_002000 [Penicillium canescens]KAJ6061978.1 hypothetical protein N7446_006098 [Penicillium canescens]
MACSSVLKWRGEDVNVNWRRCAAGATSGVLFLGAVVAVDWLPGGLWGGRMRVGMEQQAYGF